MRRVAAISACALILMTVLAGVAVEVEAAAAVSASPTVSASPGATTTGASRATPSSTAAPAATAALPLANVSATAVDPSSGRIFAVAGGSIEMFGADSGWITTITGVQGPGALAVAGGSLWVTTTANALAEIDIATSSVVRTIPTILPVDPVLVVVGHVAFTKTFNPFNYDKAVLAVDLVTGVNKAMPGFRDFSLQRASGREDRFYVVEADQGGSGRIRTRRAVPPYDVIAEVAVENTSHVGPKLNTAQVSSDGTRVWATTSGPTSSVIQELDLTTGAMIGSYQSASPWQLLPTEGAGGRLISTSSNPSRIYVHQLGNPTALASLPHPVGVLHILDVAPGGEALVVLTASGPTTVPLRPSLGGVSPASVIAAMSSTVAVNGGGLDGTTGVTVGGVPATFRITDTTTLQVDVPDTVPAGDQEVRVSTRLGDVSTTLTVVANVGATLTGTIRVGGTPSTGVGVTLRGGGLGAPMATTTDATGRYSLPGVPVGTTYRLEVAPGAGADTGQIVDRIALVPNNTSTVDVDLRPASRPVAKSSTTKVPPGGGVWGGSVNEPTTGRLFVQKNGEVLAFDADGDLIGRIRGVLNPKDITTGDGSVFVSSYFQGMLQITRIDPVALAVTGEWAIPALERDGSLAHAGHKLFLRKANPTFDEVRSFDLATGTLGPVVVPGTVTGLGRVGRDADRIMVVTAVGLRIFDASGPALTLLASADGAAYRSLPTTDGPTDRLWTGDGREHELSTLAPTGRVLAGAGGSAFSPTFGGLFTRSGVIYDGDGTTVLHNVSNGHIRLSASGEVAFSFGTNELVVHDLRPHLGPGELSDWLPYEGDYFFVEGWRLRPMTSVTVDGVPASTSYVGDTELKVDVGLAPGPHTIVVTTPWGAATLAITAYAVPPPPTVTSVSPSVVPLSGGPVRLTGTDFRFTYEIAFGGRALYGWEFTIVDDSTIEFVAPPRAAGSYAVSVENMSGWSPPGPTLTYAEMGTIRGTVRDTAGPLANMVVMVSPAASPGLVTAVVTAADGSFSVPSLPVGSYKVYVFDGRLIFGVPAERVAEWYQAAGPGTANFDAASAVVITAGSDTALAPIVLAATAPGSIAGMVTDGAAPLPGVVVMVSPASRQEVSAYAVTGADGRFTVAGLAPGSYKVVAVHGPVLYGLPPAYASEYYDDIADSPSAFAAAPAVTVTASTATTLRTIAMQRL